MTSFLGYRYIEPVSVVPIRVRADVQGLNTDRQVILHSGHRWDMEIPLSGAGLSYSKLRAHQLKFDSNTPFVIPMPQQVGANGKDVGRTEYDSALRLVVTNGATAGSTTIAAVSNTSGVTLHAGRYVSFTGHQTNGTLVKPYQVVEDVTFADTTTLHNIQIEPGLMAAVARTTGRVHVEPNARVCWQPEAVDAGIVANVDGYANLVLDVYEKPTG